MSEREHILRVNATYDLAVHVGDRLRRGERLSMGSEDELLTAPVSGTVTRIDFDPASHEFTIAIAAED